MRKFFVSALVMISLMLFLASLSFAQDGCPVQFQFNETVAGARAVFTNTRTRRVVRSVSLASGDSASLRLPDGSYEIRVSKTGYRTAVGAHSFECNPTAISPISLITVDLQRGNSRQITRNSISVTLMRVGVPSYREGTGNRQTELNPQPSGQSDPQIPPPQPARRRNQPGIISKGFLNGSATSLPQPPYPRAARAVRAAGTVSVQVTVDEDGNVISASAAGGHPLLRQAAVGAARRAKFRPTLLSGQPVKVTGIIVYTFTAQ